LLSWLNSSKLPLAPGISKYPIQPCKFGVESAVPLFGAPYGIGVKNAMSKKRSNVTPVAEWFCP
jgi:hypothetical protein